MRTTKMRSDAIEEPRSDVTEEPCIPPPTEDIEEMLTDMPTEKTSDASIRVPLNLRKKEASKPLYLMRYE